MSFSLQNQSQGLPYLFGYKTEFVYFLNNPKNLDPSYKMDLDLWDCLNNPKNLDPSYKMDLDLWDCSGRVKVVLQQHRSDLVICSQSR